MTYDTYRLPDGRLVKVDASAAKGLNIIDFQLADGTMVKATRVLSARDLDFQLIVQRIVTGEQ